MMLLKLLTSSHALNSRPFEQLCEEMDAEHGRFLLYKEIRWLSRGKSLVRVFELRELLQRFLSEKKSPLAAHFSGSQNWLTCGIYLTTHRTQLSSRWQHLKPNWICGDRASTEAYFKHQWGFWVRLITRLCF